MSEEHHLVARIENDALTGDELEIIRVRGVETISQLFSFEIHCIGAVGAAAPVPAEDLLNKSTSLIFFDGTEEMRRIQGTVSRVRDYAEPGSDRPHVVLTFVPRAYPAAEFKTLDVFLDMAVPNIVDQVLTRSRLTAGSDYDIDDLKGRSAASEGENGSKDYSCVEYTVQYKESNHAFISRLCEHLGVFYFFDSEGVMLFGDSNDVFQALERTPEVNYDPLTGARRADRVMSLELTTKNLPARYVMRDYNWRNPGVDMMGQADVIADGVGQIVEYGGHFKTPEQGNGLAEIRAQELRATRFVYDGTSNNPSFTAGGTFMLIGHPMGDMELLITDVHHEFGGTGGEGSEYRNRFKAIPRDTTYRPPRITPKPRVDGALTGIVQGGSGTEFGEIDGQGRYRVKFMFDTAERGEGQASRAVRMAQPSAGGGQGFSFPLRTGVEVILTCIDGDPDRPVITGAMPNPNAPSPTTANNPNKNVIKTSKNQIDIDDDQARVKITTDGHGTELQLGSPNEPNEGYILKTMSDGVGTAGKLIGSTSPLVSTLAEYRQSMANKNIIAAAGPPNPLEGFAKFKKFASAALDFASGALDAADATMGFIKGTADSIAEAGKTNANAAKDKLIKQTLGDSPDNKYDKEKAKKTVTSSDGTPLTITESEDDFRERKYKDAMAKRKQDAAAAAAAGDQEKAKQLAADPPEEVAAADVVGFEAGGYVIGSASAAQSVSDSVDSASKKKWYNGAKSIIGTTKAIRDTHKQLKDLKKTVAEAGGLWGSAINITAEAQKAKEFVKANAWVSGYNAILGNTERHRHTGAPVAQPYNIQASSHSIAIYGTKNAYLMGLSTGVFGGKAVGLKAKNTVQVSSKNNLELATKKLFVSVNGVANTKIQGGEAVFVKKNVMHTYEGWFKNKVKKKIQVESEDEKIEVKAKTGWILDGGDKIDAKAKKFTLKTTEKNVLIESNTEFWLKAKKDAKINADKHAMSHGKEKFSGKSDKGGIEATTSKTKVWQQSSKLEMESSKSSFKSSQIEVNGSSKAAFKGGGGKIELKTGKVFLG